MASGLTPIADTRPPICSDYIGQTAISMRALQLYAPKADKAAYDQADSTRRVLDRESAGQEQ